VVGAAGTDETDETLDIGYLENKGEIGLMRVVNIIESLPSGK